MNPKLVPLSTLIAAALLVSHQTSIAISYTFDVDSSSGIGSGVFSIDLPEAWPANIGHVTVLPASSFSGSLAGGDAWGSLFVSLSELIERPDTASLFGASTALISFAIPAGGLGVDPVTALENIPGITRHTVGVPDAGVTALLLATSCTGLIFLRRRWACAS